VIERVWWSCALKETETPEAGSVGAEGEIALLIGIDS
jgi:hypothetical protein